MRAGKFNEPLSTAATSPPDGGDSAVAADAAAGTGGRKVVVLMLLLRLETFETDLLISYSLPEPTTETPNTDASPPPGDDDSAEAYGGVPLDRTEGVVVRSHLDILCSYYAQHDPSKTPAG